jgi:hypothetical protein
MTDHHDNDVDFEGDMDDHIDADQQTSHDDSMKDEESSQHSSDDKNKTTEKEEERKKLELRAQKFGSVVPKPNLHGISESDVVVIESSKNQGIDNVTDKVTSK